jgi:hypothetical protein
MQIVKVMGGLGNQMFSYAFALRLRSLGRQVALDTSWYDRIQAHNGWELDRIFRLDLPLCSAADRDRLGDLERGLVSRVRRKFLGTRKSHVVEHRRRYDARFLSIAGDAYFDGYWQSPRYHVGIESEIESAFSFPPKLEPEAAGVLGASAGRTTIGVHVRRGDYLKSDDLGGVCGEAYYRRAIGFLSENAVQPLVIFFSDDLDWCRAHLAAGLDAVFVDWNRGADSWKDLRLMTLCDRLAISNSSFGWWGARLGRDKARLVVAPDRWYGRHTKDNTDVALTSWFRIQAGD